MNSDKKKSDDYWMGVRDALRMIDSFYRWSRQNPKRAKKLEDFIADGLIAAAKRCESCLSKELGVGFKGEEDEDEASVELEETSESSKIPVFFEESSIESAETPSDIEAPPTSEPILDETQPEPFDIGEADKVHTEDSRDFSSEFELVEPEPLITKTEEIEIEEEIPSISDSTEFPPDTSMKSSSDELAKEGEEITTIDEGFTQEDTVEPSSSTEDKSITEDSKPSKTTPRFSWDAHDEMAPSSDKEPKESHPAKVRIWSPYDEPTTTESTDSEDYIEESDSGTTPSTTEEPPAPPPPPESDEDEEERKRRARRLFFGT